MTNGDELLLKNSFFFYSLKVSSCLPGALKAPEPAVSVFGSLWYLGKEASNCAENIIAGAIFDG